MRNLAMQARVSELRQTRFMLEEAIVDGAASIDRRQMLGMRKMTEAKAYGVACYDAQSCSRIVCQLSSVILIEPA